MPHAEQADPDARLAELQEDHRRAEARVAELSKHLSLTSDEQVELLQLKKYKLQLKDEIRALTRR